MLREFLDFIRRGNVLDLAVAVIIGAAFGLIITSLVDDIIMPLIGLLLGGIDFTSLAIQVGDASINYGNFIQAIVNFVIIAFAVFLLIRAVKSFERQKEAAPTPPAAPPAEEQLLREIRDLLKADLERRR